MTISVMTLPVSSPLCDLATVSVYDGPSSSALLIQRGSGGSVRATATVPPWCDHLSMFRVMVQSWQRHLTSRSLAGTPLRPHSLSLPHCLSFPAAHPRMMSVLPQVVEGGGGGHRNMLKLKIAVGLRCACVCSLPAQQMTNSVVNGTGRYLLVVFTSSLNDAAIDSGYQLYLGFGSSPTAPSATAQLLMAPRCGALMSISTFSSVALEPTGMQCVPTAF